MSSSTEKTKYSGPWRNFWAGVCGATCGVIVTCPLELVKTRSQSSFNARYGGVNGVITGMKSVVKNEGFFSLWKGCLLMLASVVPTRGVHFLVYESSKPFFNEHFPSMSSTLNALCRSIIAGATAVTFCNPIWVIKTRIQLQTNVEPELISCKECNAIERDLHVMPPALRALRIITASAMRFFVFTAKKGFAASSKGSLFPIWVSQKRPFNLPVMTVSNDSFTTTTIIPPNFAYFFLTFHKSKLFWTAALAKLVATTATYPHEVVRTRMRERTVGTAYSTLLSSFKSLYRESGFRGMYVGFTAHVLRTVPNAAIMFMIVEVVLNNSL